jgi:hypothetical protein
MKSITLTKEERDKTLTGEVLLIYRNHKRNFNNGDLLFVKEGFFDHNDVGYLHEDYEWSRGADIESNWTSANQMKEHQSRITVKVVSSILVRKGVVWYRRLEIVKVG